MAEDVLDDREVGRRVEVGAERLQMLEMSGGLVGQAGRGVPGSLRLPVIRYRHVGEVGN